MAALLALSLTSWPSPASEDAGASVAFTAAFQYFPGDNDLPPPASELHVEEGGTLTYWNLDPIDHSLTELDPPGGLTRFDSGLVAVQDGPVEVAGVPALSPGTYSFYCLDHSSMLGTLIVDPAP